MITSFEKQMNRFNGGIQNGTVATDARARLLDAQCKNIKNKVFNTLVHVYPNLVMKTRVDKKDIPGGITACCPDGGAWYYNDTLIAAFEGKKQQDRGNAIERWYKNNFVCRTINPNVSYVTFCTGEGAYENGQIGIGLHVSHYEKGFNVYHPGWNSAYLKTDSFTEDEIENIMMEVISERIDTLFPGTTV